MKRWRLSGKSASSQPRLPGILPPIKKHRLATPHEQALNLAKARLGIVILFFAVAWVTIGGRLAYLTLSGGTERQMATARTNTDSVSNRADIIDRNGVLLATSLPTISLCADSKAIIDVNEAANQLMQVLPDLKANELVEYLGNGKRCSALKRHISPRQYYEVNKLGIAGLQFLPDERRIYPAGNLTAHVVGYSDVDDNGLAGIEKSQDKRLNDNPEPLALALDLRIQTVLHKELDAAMREFHAEAASGLIMDIRTGEIVSMVSLPDFDPGRAGTATEEQRFNRSTLGVYEMGSIFKIFNTALALDSGLVHLSDTFDTVHPIEIGRHQIKDFENEDHNLNVAEIFVHSSNIGSAHIAERFGGVKQRAFFARLGFTQKISLELPEVGAPLIPSAQDWGEPTTLTAAFGHGIAINAVQLASAVATIVNDGRPVQPTMLKRPESYEQDVNTVISPRTSALMRGLMRLVVTRGTAKKAEVSGFMVGGKTGTADKLSANHKYEGGRRSSFVGLFPIQSPKFIIFAMLDDPKGNAKTQGFATAGWVVAPTVSNIISQIGPLFGMAPLPRDIQEATERQIMKPLGSHLVDGVPASDMTAYASATQSNRQ